MSECSVRVRRVIKAPCHRCFAAWANPDQMVHWFAPGGLTAPEIVADVRVGGAYCIAMSGEAKGNCERAVVSGVYTEVVPDVRLAFTWQTSKDPHGETRVTVEFRDTAEGTEITLTHTGFSTDEVAAQHEAGWLGCLDKLTEVVASPDDDYTKTLVLSAPCETVFAALATLDGPKNWWTRRVSGDASEGGDLRFAFAGVDGGCLMHVDRADRPCFVQWSCRESTILPDWVGTVITFDLREHSAGCELHFRHAGLTPALDCFALCQRGWNQYLPSLQSYVETGKGQPKGG